MHFLQTLQTLYKLQIFSNELLMILLQLCMSLSKISYKLPSNFLQTTHTLLKNFTNLLHVSCVLFVSFLCFYSFKHLIYFPCECISIFIRMRVTYHSGYNDFFSLELFVVKSTCLKKGSKIILSHTANTTLEFYFLPLSL